MWNNFAGKKNCNNHLEIAENISAGKKRKQLLGNKWCRTFLGGKKLKKNYVLGNSVEQFCGKKTKKNYLEIVSTFVLREKKAKNKNVPLEGTPQINRPRQHMSLNPERTTPVLGGKSN